MQLGDTQEAVAGYPRKSQSKPAIIGYSQEAENGLTSLTCSNGVDVCVLSTRPFCLACFLQPNNLLFGLHILYPPTFLLEIPPLFDVNGGIL
jgi:hypothetical protein